MMPCQFRYNFRSEPALEYVDPTLQLPDLQKTIGGATVRFWIIFSTIATPIIIGSSRRADRVIYFPRAADVTSQPARRSYMGQHI